MENSSFGPEKQDDETDKAGSRKKRGSNALSRYLSGLRRREHETQGESTSQDERPRRVSRLLNRLFPRMVEYPDHTGAKAAESESSDLQEHAFNHEAWFSWTKLASARVEAASDDSADTLPGTRTNPAEATQDTHEAGAVIRDDTAALEHEASRSTEAALDTTERQRAVESVYGEEAPFDTTEQEDTPLDSTGEPDSEAQRVVQLAPEQSQAEKTVERGVGIALPTLLVGAEYLARKKADKKLEARVNEKIQATQKEQKRSDQLRQELDQVVRQNREQLAELRKARSAQEHEKQPAPAAEKNPQPSTLVEARPERPRLDKIEQSQVSPLQEIVKPRNVMEQVADAAEHNRPVERAFERSHEVKDDQPVVVQSGATSVGSVVAAQAALHSDGVQRSTHNPDDTDGLPTVYEPMSTLQYRQAAAMGFWTAIIIIILGVAAWLMVK